MKQEVARKCRGISKHKTLSTYLTRGTPRHFEKKGGRGQCCIPPLPTTWIENVNKS